jgi:hypothetical protein
MQAIGTLSSKGSIPESGRDFARRRPSHDRSNDIELAAHLPTTPGGNLRSFVCWCALERSLDDCKTTKANGVHDLIQQPHA